MERRGGLIRLGVDVLRFFGSALVPIGSSSGPPPSDHVVTVLQAGCNCSYSSPGLSWERYQLSKKILRIRYCSMIWGTE